MRKTPGKLTVLNRPGAPPIRLFPAGISRHASGRAGASQAAGKRPSADNHPGAKAPRLLNLRLLDALTDEQLAATILPRGKAVASYFVHIHMARFYWLERRARALAKTLKKIPAGSAPRATVRQALIDSGEAMGELFAQAERIGTIKGVKLGPVGFLGYALAHEGHHRGQILLHLKVAKQPVDRATSYSLWYWNKI